MDNKKFKILAIVDAVIIVALIVIPKPSSEPVPE